MTPARQECGVFFYALEGVLRCCDRYVKLAEEFIAYFPSHCCGVKSPLLFMSIMSNTLVS
jgi:hypothetical protein